MQSGKALPHNAEVPPAPALYFGLQFVTGQLCTHQYDEHAYNEDFDVALDLSNAVLSRWFAAWTVAIAHQPAAGYFHDALPFFLIGKATIYCSKQGYILQDHDSDQRVKLIMAWLRHIRVFLDTHTEITAELWETLPLTGLKRRPGFESDERVQGGEAIPVPSPEEELESLVPAFMSFKLEA
jgi:hypothetical protein